MSIGEIVKPRNNCIRNPTAYLAGIWPDRLFAGLLPRNISPTNGDAIYEINNHILMFERKPEGIALQIVPWGQIGALAKLADGYGSACTLVLVNMRGPEEPLPDHPTALLIHRLHRTPIPTNLGILRNLIEAWGKHADACRVGKACLDMSWIPNPARAEAGESHP